MNSIHIQREFFSQGATLSVEYRIRQLRSLYRIVTIYQDEICQALNQDLGKSPHESYMTEVGILLRDISHTLKKLRKWSRPKRVKGNLSQFPSSSWILPQPYGVCLIISPWNYPFLLAVGPAVAAIAAGNCVIIKPSESSPATSELLSRIFNENFEQRFCRVITGGEEVSKALLMQNFDYIFFTGSAAVGRKVMEQAAQNLTPVTLELGGKSPCIVDKTADLQLTAKRIIWGKLLNSGQTCVAPDYVLVEKEIAQDLLKTLCHSIVEFYGEDPQYNDEYPKIINQRHFERLLSLLEGCDILAGGVPNRENLKISPAIVSNPSPDHPIMKEEIFGPILPVLEVENLDAAIAFVKERPAPLALYLFTRDGKAEERVMRGVSFGGGCVNNTILHLTGDELPFGGVGESGMGSYHGKAGFDTFTHYKSILKSSLLLDVTLRYPPFRNKLKWIKWILK